MKSVHYRRNESVSSPEVLEQASRSLLIVAPHLDDELLEPLFALSEPVEISLLTSRETVEDGGRKLRDHIKQLQDINNNVDVRVTEESFPAFTIVDGEHVHCFSRASKRLAEQEPENLMEAAESLWSRSKPLASTHHEGERAVEPQESEK